MLSTKDYDFCINSYEQVEQVELVATTEDPGSPLRAPTQETGLVTACKDTCYGDLRLQMWEKASDGSKGKVHKSSFFTVLKCFFKGILTC